LNLSLSGTPASASNVGFHPTLLNSSLSGTVLQNPQLLQVRDRLVE
jgi:hypothetical protein